jgi:hypothetical protein
VTLLSASASCCNLISGLTTYPDPGTTLSHARIRVFIDDANWNAVLEEC